MPIVPLKSIYYVSSEDPAFPATNLLSNSGKKWKSKESGEKSIYVVLELEEPVVINGIDIGNEHSAFVEVFAKKKGASDDTYKELLLTCSFMTPTESRNSETVNRVRCFDQIALVESNRNEKFDMLKVICTQGFNRHVKFGLSFIKIHSPKAVGASIKKDEPFKAMFGKFQMRESSPDSPDSNGGSNSLFHRWKQSKDKLDVHNTTAASSIRDATTPSALNRKLPSFLNKTKVHNNNTSFRIDDEDDDDENGSKKKLKQRDRDYDKMLYDDEDEKPNEKYDRILEEEKLKRQKEREKAKEKELEKEREKKMNKERVRDKIQSVEKKDVKMDQTPKRPGGSEKMKASATKFKDFVDVDDEHPTSSTSAATPKLNTPKRPSTPYTDDVKPEPKKLKIAEKPKIYRPFNELMKGVVLVISGIQNPDRAELRRKALEMGAKYKPDWDSQSTHLICAFKNTPKYNQVHGHGKIINRDWVHKSHARRIRLPWRRFALDSNDSTKPDSEDEIYDEILKPKPVAPSTSPKITSPPKTSVQAKDKAIIDDDDVVAMYDDKSPNHYGEDSGEDTEDEIERVRQQQIKPEDEKPAEQKVFDLSTDDDENTQRDTQSFDFFKPFKFFVHENIPSIDRIKLRNFIRRYQGEVVKSEDGATHIIADSKINKLPTGFSGEVVKPRWVYESSDMECLLPTRRYKFD